MMPDAENVVIDHLDQLLDPPVRLTVPNPRPSLFATVRRVGGPRMNLVADNAMLTVEAWGPDPVQAKHLLEQARSAIHAMRGQVIDGVTVYRPVEVSGPVNLPDPASTQARYTQTFQVPMRALPEES